MWDQLYQKKNNLDRFIPPRPLPNPLLNNQPQPPSHSQNYRAFLQKQILQDSPMQDLSNISMNSMVQQPFAMAPIKQLLAKRDSMQCRTSQRNINTAPQKVLDAPDIKDDYYLNLLDWSNRGLLSIGLGERVYLYSPLAIQQLCFKEDDYICSLSFHPAGDQLAVGLSSGKTQLYDTERGSLVRTIKGHSNRVSSSAFTYGMLFTGSKDSKILAHDYRSPCTPIMKFQGHRGQICGLKHDPCGLASGSNDNSAFIWDISTGKPRFQLTGHKAAVKALAWCPWQRNLLATGGGTSDQTMRFWNIQTGKLINSVNTNSQVCSLIWNRHERQILSSHGFSQNQLSLWKYQYPNCQKVADFHGHSQRVLHMVMAPDNSTICTASADETIRFWKVFEGTSGFEEDQENKSCSLNTKYCSLR